MQIKMHVCYYYNVLIFVILCCVSIVSCYNVDTQSVISHHGPRDSMFGFTVAAHVSLGASMVLVGAPKAQTQQPNVTNGGAVYKCVTYSNNTCHQIPFDSTDVLNRPSKDIANFPCVEEGSLNVKDACVDGVKVQVEVHSQLNSVWNKNKGDYSLNGNIIDQKSHQWFGSTLYSAGRDGPVVACASRYIWFSTKYERRDPVGTCYVSRNNFRDFSEYSPCRTSQWGYHRQGSCQAGFSATISKDGNNLFVGAPGNCYWQGRMYSIDAQAKFPYKPHLFSPFGTGDRTGKVVHQGLHSRLAVFHTADGSLIDDDSYIGYSMTVIKYKDETQEGIASGMPRGGGLFGKILLYTWNLTNFMNITGMQMGSYFGYAVAAADVNGDGHDDLIIGAPLYTPLNNEGKYEVGKVYVVYQVSKMGRFMKLDELKGIKSKSRFGLSLASLGDINLDGYRDFAVGAPYDGPHERGAVYIYHGSAKGVMQKYSQVIYAEQVDTIAPSTFGFSLAGGIDLDNNAYPDTVIGAYLSDKAYFLRSRPVVKVTGYAQFETANKEISLEDKQCTALIQSKRVPVACTTIATCLNYTGVGVPRNIDLQIKYTLDTQKKKNARMFFIDGNSNVWTGNWKLSKDSTSECDRKVVYIKRDIRDKLTPIDVEVTYSMDEYYRGTELPPVLDLTSTSLKKDSVTIPKDCGIDKICIPDLALEIKPNVERYLIASNEVLFFDITVSNNGEDSFETMFFIETPSDVIYTKTEDSGDVKVSCRDTGENHTISCDIGNPLPAKRIVNFKMYFKPHYQEGMKSAYLFKAEVNSANPEDNSTLENNKIKIELPVWVNARLELKGVSRPAEVLYYNYSYYSHQKQDKDDREIGPQVIHLYTITNNGPSKINEAEILIFWPYATLSGEDLMYLLEPPEAIGNVWCETPDFNYRRYNIAKSNKSIWESFDIDVSKERNYSVDAKAGSDGIIIEQNEKKISQWSDDTKNQTHAEDRSEDVYKNASGDASGVYGVRVQETGTHVTGDGKKTIVTTSQQGGSKTTITKTFHNSSTGPDGIVHSYNELTTLTRGPHGEIIRNETSHDSRQNILRRSKEHSTPQENTSREDNRNTIHLSSQENYEPPYSSVEFDVEQPREQKNNYNYHQSQQYPHHQQHHYQRQTNTNYQQSGQYGAGQNNGNYHTTRQHQGSNYNDRQNSDLNSGQDHTSHGRRYNRTYESAHSQPSLGGAALGHGSRNEFVDLGVPDRTNDNLFRQPDETENDYTGQGSKASTMSRTHSRERPGQYNPEENRYYERSEEKRGESHWSQSGAQRYNLNIGNEPPGNSIHERKRRQANAATDFTKIVQCKATHCKFIRCVLSSLEKDQNVIIAIRTRINVNTLKNITSSKPITFSTMMVGNITSVPYIEFPLQKETVTHEIETKVLPPESDTQPDEIVPLWVVVLSAIAGALILLLLIFLFYKCGFFKRNRPSNVPERQPLNRNGHYASGDEAL